MPKPRDRGAVRAIPSLSRRKPPTSARAVLAEGAAVASQAAKIPSLKDASSQSGPDTGLPALLVALKRQNDHIAAIEEQGHHLPEGITDASRDQERRLRQALDRHTETLNRIIMTPASTPTGMRVKAQAMGLAAFGHVSSDEDGMLEETAQYGIGWDRLARSLARDVLAWTTPSRTRRTRH